MAHLHAVPDIPVANIAAHAVGDPYTAQQEKRSPWGMVPRLGVRAHAYPDPIQIMDLVLAAFFKDPSPMIRALFPIRPFEGEVFRIEEWVSKTSQFGPVGNQAPLSEYQLRRRAYTATMTDYGRQFVIDESLYNTPIEAIYRSMHMKQLIGGWNYTVFLAVMRTLVSASTIYTVLNRVSIEKDRVGKVAAIERQAALMEKMVGAMSCKELEKMDRFSYILATACRLIKQGSENGDMCANYVLLPEDLRTTMQLEQAYFASTTTEARVKEIAAYVDKQVPGLAEDFRSLLNETEWPIACGLKVMFIGPIENEEGTDDLLTGVFTTIQHRVVDTNEWCEVQIIDHEQRDWATVYTGGKSQVVGFPQIDDSDRTHLRYAGVTFAAATSSTNYSWNVNGTDYKSDAEAKKIPSLQITASRFLFIARRIAISGRSMVVGHASEQTGIMLIGGSKTAHYYQPDLRRDVTYAIFRMGFVLYEKEGQCVIPHVLFDNYLGGATANCADKGVTYATSVNTSLRTGLVSVTTDTPSPTVGAYTATKLDYRFVVVPYNQYATTYSMSQFQRNAANDVLIYNIPTSSAGSFSDEIAQTAKNIFVNAGGFFSDGVLDRVQTHNWLPLSLFGNDVSHNVCETRFRAYTAIDAFEKHGLNVSVCVLRVLIYQGRTCELSFRMAARGKHKTGDKWESLGCDTGPLMGSHTHSIDEWNGFPAMKISKRDRAD